MTMRDMTCCFTGHRNIPQGEIPILEEKLETLIRALVEEKIVYYGAGGALGFDTVSSKVVLKLRKEIPQIKLILVLPCLSQAQKWSIRDQEIYEGIKVQADKIVYTSQDYTRGCMLKRNRHLVDHSGTCVCYMTKSEGGTAYTVNYARKQNLKIINLADRKILLQREKI